MFVLQDFEPGDFFKDGSSFFFETCFLDHVLLLTDERHIRVSDQHDRAVVGDSFQWVLIVFVLR